MLSGWQQPGKRLKGWKRMLRKFKQEARTHEHNNHNVKFGQFVSIWLFTLIIVSCKNTPEIRKQAKH